MAINVSEYLPKIIGSLAIGLCIVVFWNFERQESEIATVRREYRERIAKLEGEMRSIDQQIGAIREAMKTEDDRLRGLVMYFHLPGRVGEEYFPPKGRENWPVR